MNPLSRIKPGARIRRTPDTMATQPKIAQALADCIAAYSEIELNMGLALSTLLSADVKVAMAMYVRVENRTSQGCMIRAAVEAANISQQQRDVFNAILNQLVVPGMKERDKLAHWPWGYSPDLPDALLLFKPSGELEQSIALIHEGHEPTPEISQLANLNFDHIFVVTETDLLRIVERLREADSCLRHLWLILHPRLPELSSRMRDEMLRQLTTKPRIKEGLKRLREKRSESPDATF
jgi:hypothetical protein